MIMVRQIKSVYGKCLIIKKEVKKHQKTKNKTFPLSIIANTKVPCSYVTSIIYFIIWKFIPRYYNEQI